MFLQSEFIKERALVKEDMSISNLKDSQIYISKALPVYTLQGVYESANLSILFKDFFFFSFWSNWWVSRSSVVLYLFMAIIILLNFFGFVSSIVFLLNWNLDISVIDYYSLPLYSVIMNLFIFMYKIRVYSFLHDYNYIYTYITRYAIVYFNLPFAFKRIITEVYFLTFFKCIGKYFLYSLTALHHLTSIIIYLLSRLHIQCRAQSGV